MKLCKDCKHYSRTYDGYWVSEKCLHPGTVLRDPVDGEVIFRRPRVIRADREGACGPDAKVFEPKTDALKVVGHPAQIPGPTWWQRIEQKLARLGLGAA